MGLGAGSTPSMKRTRMNTDFHGFLSAFIRVNPCPFFKGENI